MAIKKKLTRSNPDVKYLRRLFNSGKLDSSSDAKEIFRSQARFHEHYDLKRFRECVRRMKKDLYSSSRLDPGGKSE